MAAVSVGAVEWRDGLQSVWVLCGGKMGYSKYGCCVEERWAAVSVGVV